MWDPLRAYLAGRDGALALILLLGLACSAFFPAIADGFFRRVEYLGARFARRKSLAVTSLALMCIALRLSLLAFYPVPIPRVHDEFSNLLLADTLVHGRLANPPHPMHVFLDTFHVNQFPMYVSKYPPGQGAVLALGQLLGSPWIGVLLSAALMCGAVLWMLQGWLPHRWALLGGILVFLQVGIFSYWTNSYWGGAVSGLGGALVTGALPRILRNWRTRDALILALGVAILMNSRPMEGMFLCIPVAVVLVCRIISGARPSPYIAVRNFLLPAGIAVTFAAALFCYYNWRTTGNALLTPYLVNEQAYMSTPTLFWQPARPPIHFENAEFDKFYNGWVREQWMLPRTHILRYLSLTTMKFVYFFLWPELCLPLLAIFWIVRDRRVRFLLVQTVICVSGFFLAAYFQPHYAAPLLATLFALVVQGIRHIRQWEIAGRAVGLAFSRVIVLAALLFAPFHRYAVAEDPGPFAIDTRPVFEAQLEARPGKHLVVVRYSPEHDPGEEWVYNKADIDGSKVVWAREIAGIDLQPLFTYFKDRDVWLAEPDCTPPRLSPYVR